MAKMKSSTLLRLTLAKMCRVPGAWALDTRYTCHAMAKVLKMKDNRPILHHEGAQKALAYVKQFAPPKSPSRGDYGWFGNPDDYSDYGDYSNIFHGHGTGDARQQTRLTAVAFAIAAAEAVGD